MSDANDRLKEWNDTIAEGERLRNDMKQRAIGMKDGWYRRWTLRIAAFMDRWIERGKRWRNEDLLND